MDGKKARKPYDADKNGRQRCGYVRKNGAPCRKWVVPGRNRCKFHGGASHPGGPDHPTFKHGRKSKFLPGKLGEKFLEAYNDPELLSHRKYAAVFDVRVRELCERLYTKESGGLWKDLKDHWAALDVSQSHLREATEEIKQHQQAAARATDEKERSEATKAVARANEKRMAAQEQFGKALKRIGETITRGAKEESTWRELMDTADEASVMKLRETKRLESERMMMSLVDVMTLVSVIHANFRDATEAFLPPDKSKQLLMRAGESINRLLGSTGGAGRDLQKLTAPVHAVGGDGDDNKSTIDGSVVSSDDS